MLGDTCADILQQAGFRPIGALSHRMHLGVWWSGETRIELVVLQAGSAVLVKGQKVYYLRSITEEGQTWARDVRHLHDYLEGHFPEIHLSFSHYRDISGTLAEEQIRRVRSATAPRESPSSEDRLERLQQALAHRSREQTSFDHLLAEDTEGDLLAEHLRRQKTALERETQRLEQEIERERDSLALLKNLHREYERHGAAACLTFSISSNLHLVHEPGPFRDAVHSIVKELRDAHRYQVRQKLGGGRLNIQVAESEEPASSWLELWFGGALSPRQLDQLGPESLLHRDGRHHQMVFPKTDVTVDGRLCEDQKRFGARVISAMLDRVDRADAADDHPADWPASDHPLRLGRLVRNGKPGREPAVVPLNRFHHGYISGKTGSGKSYAWRVVVEEATEAEDVAILVLDPRNQAVGLLAPEDRASILDLYPEHGMSADQARGYAFNYYAPAKEYAEPLPADLAALATQRSIVSFRGMEDGDRCSLFARILDAAFDAYAQEESDTPRLLVLVEEAHRFTKKQVAKEVREAGERAELAMDRFLREGRKYGLCMLVVSQSHRDFAYGAAGVRQNTTTKIFLHNSDRELEYAADFLGDGRQILRLPPATALACNPAWGAIAIRFRPPRSKVWEYSDADTRRLLGSFQPTSGPLSDSAQAALDFVRDAYARDGRGPNLSTLGDHLGLSSKRAIQRLVRELERAKVVHTRRLNERGRPRVVEPALPAPDQTADGSGTERGTDDPNMSSWHLKNAQTQTAGQVDAGDSVRCRERNHKGAL